mgnify:CR=1 FL=1
MFCGGPETVHVTRDEAESTRHTVSLGLSQQMLNIHGAEGK